MEALKNNIGEVLKGFSGDFGVYIKDLDRGVELSIGAMEKFHAASIIKIPILWECLKQIEKGEKSLDDELILRDEDKVGGAGVLQILHDGMKLTMRDLMNLMIDISDNTASNMLMDYVGRENINHTLDTLGLVNTLVARKLMRVIPGIYNYTCPKDMGRLLERFVQANGLNRSYAQMGIDILLNQQFNDRISRELIFCGECNHRIGDETICPNCGGYTRDVDPKSMEFAHKTGEIVGVVHDAGILYMGNKKIIVVALTKNLKNNRDGYDVLSQIGLEIHRFFQ